MLRLTLVRRQRKMTKLDVAIGAHIDPGTMSQIELEKMPFYVGHKIRIAHFLNITDPSMLGEHLSSEEEELANHLGEPKSRRGRPKNSINKHNHKSLGERIEDLEKRVCILEGGANETGIG